MCPSLDTYGFITATYYHIIAQQLCMKQQDHFVK